MRENSANLHTDIKVYNGVERMAIRGEGRPSIKNIMLHNFVTQFITFKLLTPAVNHVFAPCSEYFM